MLAIVSSGLFLTLLKRIIDNLANKYVKYVDVYMQDIYGEYNIDSLLLWNSYHL